MAERIARMAEEENLPSIDYVYSLNKVEVSDANQDPFAVSGEVVKTYRGVSPNLKRRVTNELKKYNKSADGQTGSKQITEEDAVTGYDAFEVVTPPHSLESFAAIYEMSEPHYAAVNAKVANIVGLGYKLVETNKTKRAMERVDGEDKINRARQRIELARESLEEQVEALNDDQTFSEILQNVWRDYEVTGNGYIEVGRNRDGSIGYVGYIPAITMRVRRRRDGFVQISGKDAAFFRNFGDTKTANPINSEQPNEIIHLKRHTPLNTYYGVPDIVAAQNAVAGSQYADRFNMDFFENKAVPRHLITLKGANLGSTAQADLLAFFETGLKGQNHRSMFIPLPPDDGLSKVEFNIESIDTKIQESSFNNYQKANMNKILMVHRVPITKVSIADSASLAIARDADKTFKEQVCQPEQRNLEKKINRIIKTFGDAFEMKLNEMTLTDADTQSKIDERMVKVGVWLPNEVRARDGLAAIDGGDERVDLNAKDKIAQAQAEATTQRERNSTRSAAASDSAGEARQPKGDGRATG